jgi:hypothetical protein
MKWTWVTSALALAVGLVAPSTALAAGGPVPPSQDSSVSVPGSAVRYAAVGSGRDTIVKRFDGSAISALHVSGHYGVPGVDYSGTATGLSADGRTLILAQMFGPRAPRTTRLLVLATTPRLAVRTRVVLPGWSTVDAISPDGRRLYLIQYKSSDISQYAVRAYDLVAHRLLPKPIVDPREPDEKMTGFPVTRVMSAGNRWAYTLYFRPSDAPFIHALDTAHGRAVCVDLPSTLGADISDGRLRLTGAGGTLEVLVNGVTGASVDTRTFAVTPGAGHAGSARIKPVSQAREVGSGGVPWDLIALGVVALGALVAVVTRRAAPAPIWRHRLRP